MNTDRMMGAVDDATEPSRYLELCRRVAGRLGVPAVDDTVLLGVSDALDFLVLTVGMLVYAQKDNPSAVYVYVMFVDAHDGSTPDDCMTDREQDLVRWIVNMAMRVDETLATDIMCLHFRGLKGTPQFRVRPFGIEFRLV